jgi:hypothetical protein
VGLIDEATGAIQIAEGCVISPGMSKADFAALWEGDSCRVLHARGDSAYLGSSYRARFVDAQGRELVLTVGFADEQVSLVGLLYLLPREDDPRSSTAVWTEENERQRQVLHDAILREWLGDPPYAYSWGGVRSVYDSRSGFSAIQIVYET